MSERPAYKTCMWCGKQRTKFSGFEKQCIVSNRWSEMCNYCFGYNNRVMRNNPFAGILPNLIRRVGFEEKCD